MFEYIYGPIASYPNYISKADYAYDKSTNLADLATYIADGVKVSQLPLQMHSSWRE